MFKNKNICKTKLTLTTNCNLSCSYCFVEKTTEDMSWDVAKKAIDVLIESEGKEKILSLYGGEPLINFDLIEKICPYATDQAKINNKKITITICTNLTLLDEKHLNLFEKYGVKVIFSLVGKKEQHDTERFFKNNLGTYDIIITKLRKMLKIIKKENIGISFCVFPDKVKDLKDNFLELLGLGINYFNFEIIREYKQWTEEDLTNFNSQYDQIIKYVLSEIDKDNFIFINPINWKIIHERLGNDRCPFNYILEVYPNGDMAFSPFLLNDPDKRKYLIGNLKEDKQYRFKSCSFSEESELCKNCIGNYFDQYASDVGADSIYKAYHNKSLEATRDILKKAGDNEKFRRYISMIKEGMCF